MSYNQGRPDPRKSGGGRGRGFAGGSGGRGGGIGGGGASLPSNRSFKKSSNGQGGQSRIVPASLGPEPSSANATQRVTQNGVHGPPSLQGSSTTAMQSGPPKPADTPLQRPSRALPKAPSSQSSTVNSDSASPSTPVKGDGTKPFALQFGTISPGIVNGLQIPARTSSAPPNLDEQKQNQVHRNSFRAVPTQPIPPVPKQQPQQTRKDTAVVSQFTSGETRPPIQVKREIQVQQQILTNPPPKSANLPIPGISMPMPFQPPIPLQFSAPGPQQIPINLSIGNTPQIPQHMLYQNIHSHQMPPHMTFGPQITPVAPLPNPPFGITAPQFPQQQQQTNKFGGNRKSMAVKITHPDTHEELKLDKATSQPQPVASFTPYFSPNPYNSSMIYYGNNQLVNMGSQPQRYNQSVGQSGQVSVKPVNTQFGQKVGVSSVTISKPVSKTDESKLKAGGESSVIDQPKGREVLIESSQPQATTSDSKEGELSRSLDSLKDQPMETIYKEVKPSQQNEQVDESASGTMTNSSLVNVSKVDNCEDVKTKQLTESPENTHDRSRENMSIATTGPSYKDTSNTTSCLDTEGTENTHESSREDICTVTEDSVLGQTDNVSSKVEYIKNESDKLENGKSEGSKLSTLESADTKNTLTESSEIVEPVIFLKQECRVQDSQRDTDFSDTSVESEPKNDELETSSNHDACSTFFIEPHSESVTTESSATCEKTNKAEALTSETKHKATLELLAKPKPTGGKKKKILRDVLSKADAAGTSDLYNAYTGPDEKQQLPDAVESSNSSLTIHEKNTNTDNTDNSDVVAFEEDDHSKAEVDDWEDAAEMSTPKLDNGKTINKAIKQYTRDFLFTFSEQFTDLPLGFEIGSDIADAVMCAHVGDRNSYPSPGKINRSPGSSRSDRRGLGIMDEEKWKQPGNFNLQNIGNSNIRPGQNVNHGVLRKPYGQPVNQFGHPMNQYGQPVIFGQSMNQFHLNLSGNMQSMVPQGQLQYNSDAARWRSNFNPSGLMTLPPQTPMQVMHKAEKKYEVGKVSDEEQAKQRQLKGILNKLTPQNFDKLFQQVKEVNIDNTETLSGVISQIFDKALTEPTFCEMYANFCFHLSGVLPDFMENEEKITFKRKLLNKCQEEFERGEREEAEANRIEKEGEIKQSDQEREEKRIKARRRMLGNIRLIGELYKKKMLTERIMHECIQKLLGEQQNPDEEDLEALCKLMSTIGDQIDHAKAKIHMDTYFDSMLKLSTNLKLSSRVRFMLRDVIDLRKNRWQQRRKVEGPKKIEEVHRDAAQERQSQTNRLTRGPSMGTTSRRMPDYNPRVSLALPSSSSIRGMPPQQRGYGMQDTRFEDRHPLENRTLSYPLSQRPIDDNSITLGPQGGLARGMSRGQPLMPSGTTIYNSTPDRIPHSLREDLTPRHMPEKVMPTTVSPLQPQRSVGGTGSDAKLTSEEVLRDKLIMTMKEFYSAKDEKEVELCIRELNSPNLYPSMVSLWVTDSFERKDMEREMLATLLVNLCKSRDNLLSQAQLSQGFESVLSTLEDAVNDAPRAAEFLGRIFVKVILENVVPLSDIAKLIYEGGEEPGSLLESGLASEVLGSVLEIIKIEKGESVIKDIIMTSNLRLEDFKPPRPLKSKKLDAFLWKGV